MGRSGRLLSAWAAWAACFLLGPLAFCLGRLGRLLSAWAAWAACFLLGPLAFCLGRLGRLLSAWAACCRMARSINMSSEVSAGTLTKPVTRRCSSCNATHPVTLLASGRRVRPCQWPPRSRSDPGACLPRVLPTMDVDLYPSHPSREEPVSTSGDECAPARPPAFPVRTLSCCGAHEPFMPRC